MSNLHRPRRVVPLAALAVAGVLVPIGCRSTPTPETAATTTTVPLTSVATVAELQQKLSAAGIACKLEYESLRDDQKELSLCVIDGERATLTVWNQPGVLDAFLTSPDRTASGATAVGRNWTVDVQSAVVAQKLATALGGTVKLPTG